MNYLLILLILNVTVLIHELGHLFAARYYGVPVATFSVGMGPRIWGFTWHETDMRLSLFPIGGYVSFDVEDDEVADGDLIPVQHALPFGIGSVSFGGSNPNRTGSPLDVCPLRARLSIFLAGPVVNIMAGAIAFTFYLIQRS